MGLFNRRPPADEISVANTKFFRNEPDELPDSIDSDKEDNPTLEKNAEELHEPVSAPEIKPFEVRLHTVKHEEVEAPEIIEDVAQPPAAVELVVEKPKLPTLDGKSLLEKIDSIVLSMKEIGAQRDELNNQLMAKENAIEEIHSMLKTAQDEKKEITGRLAASEEQWNHLKAELKHLTD